MRIFVGTYTHGASEGIYVGRFDAGSGMLSIDQVVEGVENPSFLALDSRGTHLYAVNELTEFEGESAGAVTAFAVDRATGDLRRLNQVSSRGAAPCHVTVDRTGRFALVANYLGGSAAVLPIEAGGALGPAVAVVQHSGSGTRPDRQEGPHVHSVTLDRANRFAFVADLGIDRLVTYRFDDEGGTLIPIEGSDVEVRPGAGPRHLAFHPTGRWAYLINELDSTLTQLVYDGDRGVLTERQTIGTLPSNFSAQNTAAEVQVDPAGRHVYASNRGHDSIAVFAVARDTGELSLVQHQSTLGRTPRHFAIDPTGRYLLAANQDSDSIVVFAIHRQTGRLRPIGHTVEVPSPVCLRFA